MNTSLEPFEKVTEGAKTALVLKEETAAVAGALLSRKGCVPAGQAGRGEVMRFELSSGSGILRPYLRGGFIRHFMKETYLFHNRPLREFELHQALYGEGLKVPQPLGVVWERTGPCYRGAIATREIEGENLLQYLEKDPRDNEKVIPQCGQVIRQMHDMGVYHADLQLQNLLVGKDGIYIIDFDNARRLPNLSELNRGRNLLRLRRSMEKNGIALHHFETLCKAYGEGELPPWLDRLYQAKGKVSDTLR